MKQHGEYYFKEYKRIDGTFGKSKYMVKKPYFLCDRCEKQFKQRYSVKEASRNGFRAKEDSVIEISRDYDVCQSCIDTMLKQRMVREGKI